MIISLSLICTVVSSEDTWWIFVRKEPLCHLKDGVEERGRERWNNRTDYSINSISRGKLFSRGEKERKTIECISKVVSKYNWPGMIKCMCVAIHTHTYTVPQVTRLELMREKQGERNSLARSFDAQFTLCNRVASSFPLHSFISSSLHFVFSLVSSLYCPRDQCPVSQRKWFDLCIHPFVSFHRLIDEQLNANDSLSLIKLFIIQVNRCNQRLPSSFVVSQVISSKWRWEVHLIIQQLNEWVIPSNISPSLETSQLSFCAHCPWEQNTQQVWRKIHGTP